MLTGLLVSLLAVAPAAADETGDPPSAGVVPGTTLGAPPEAPPGATVAPEALLRAAIDLYLDGRPAEARSALEGVLALGPALPAAVREDALAYLGDILYSENGASAARGVFESLLAEAPGYQMDPFNHPPEVVRHFETLRRELVPTAAGPPPRRAQRDPYPWTIALPCGVYYFQERRVIPGISVAALQIAGAGVSIWARGEMIATNDRVHDPEDPIRPSDDADSRVRAAYDRLYAANLAAGIVGWAAYVVPVTVETIRWGTRGGAASVSVAPGQVRLTGVF